MMARICTIKGISEAARRSSFTNGSAATISPDSSDKSAARRFAFALS